LRRALSGGLWLRAGGRRIGRRWCGDGSAAATGSSLLSGTTWVSFFVLFICLSSRENQEWEFKEDLIFFILCGV
jgi:hypothetical protein